MKKEKKYNFTRRRTRDLRLGKKALTTLCRQVYFAGCRLQVETTCLFELKSNKPHLYQPNRK